MRLPYIDPTTLTSETDLAILQRVEARRAPRPLLPLDLTLLHSPPVADAWNTFLGTIRTRTTLPTNLLELAICRVALHNRAWFEWKHHLPLLIASDSFQADPGKVEVVGIVDVGEEERARLSESEWAVLRYADCMTREVEVSEEVFGEVRRAFGGEERKVVELTAVVGAYNTVSRFLVALDVGEMNGKVPEGVDVEGSEKKS